MHSALVGGPNQQQHQVSACSPTNHQEGWQALLGLERKMTFSEYFLHVRPWVYITLLEAPNLCASTAGHQALLAIILCPWDFLGKSPGADCYALLQQIFPTQGSNLCLVSYVSSIGR